MLRKSKVAIVTGAGSGIGRAVAKALNEDGWNVILAGRRQKSLDETAALCTGNEVLAIPTDVKDPLSVKNLFAQALKAYGRLDLLFNNAGVSAPEKPMEELTIEEWKNVIDTNLNGVFYCTREAFRIMKSQDPMGGRIINNGSLSAHVPRPFSAPYSASKHAVTGLTKSTSLDGRAYSIACGQIDIGNSKSEMTKKMEKGTLQADGSYKTEPTMSPEDIGRSIVYMAGLPLNTNVPFLTIMANEMPYIGRG